MKAIATLSPEDSAQLAAHLASLQISSITNPCVEEGDIESITLSVDDERYDDACAAAESWYQARMDEKARRAKRVCPKCRSLHLSYQGQETCGHVYKCDDCGALIVQRA